MMLHKSLDPLVLLSNETQPLSIFYISFRPFVKRLGRHVIKNISYFAFFQFIFNSVTLDESAVNPLQSALKVRKF